MSDDEPGCNSKVIEPGSAGDTDLDLDTLFDLLSHRHRRATLEFFSNESNTVFELGTVANYIGDNEDVRENDRELISIELHHRHLPKLQDTGVIEYDTRTKTIRYHGSPALERSIAQYTKLEEL